MIYCCSDLHLGHDKSFIYEPRGFKSAEENAIAISKHFKEILTPEDDLYILGDTLVGPDSDEYLPWLTEIPGRLHLLWGNHDSDRRKELLSNLPNVVETLGCGSMLKYNKWHFLFRFTYLRMFLIFYFFTCTIIYCTNIFSFSIK